MIVIAVRDVAIVKMMRKRMKHSLGQHPRQRFNLN
jgi:hypothetical protein